MIVIINILEDPSYLHLPFFCRRKKEKQTKPPNNKHPPPKAILNINSYINTIKIIKSVLTTILISLEKKNILFLSEACWMIASTVKCQNAVFLFLPPETEKQKESVISTTLNDHAELYQDKIILWL